MFRSVPTELIPVLLSAVLLFAPNAYAAETQGNLLRVQRTASPTKSATRLSRPVRTDGGEHCCDQGATKGESSEAVKQHIRGFLNGISSRWWRNFRNPTFCPFIICGGSCANMMGVPIVGAYTPSQLMSDETPCSIESVESSGGCCMSHGSSKARSLDVGSVKDIANASSCKTSENSLKAGRDCCSAK